MPLLTACRCSEPRPEDAEHVFRGVGLAKLDFVMAEDRDRGRSEKVRVTDQRTGDDDLLRRRRLSGSSALVGLDAGWRRLVARRGRRRVALRVGGGHRRRRRRFRNGLVLGERRRCDRDPCNDGGRQQRPLKVLFDISFPF